VWAFPERVWAFPEWVWAFPEWVWPFPERVWAFPEWVSWFPELRGALDPRKPRRPVYIRLAGFNSGCDGPLPGDFPKMHGREPDFTALE
jgi:hypothetical protein